MSKRAASHSGGLRSEAAKNRRVVYKHVLDTPFNIKWPDVSSDDCAIVLDMLCEMLVPIREYRKSDRGSTEKKDVDSDASRKSKKRKKAESNNEAAEKPSTALANSTGPPLPSTNDAKAPPILAHTFIGINSVTRLLEKSIQNKNHPPPAIIFVCKGDLSPPHLYNHLGSMSAMLPSMLLFPLPKGAEAKLSTALGIRAVGAIGFKSGNRDVDDIATVSSRMVQPLTASWLPKVTSPSSLDKGVASTVESGQKKLATPVPGLVPYEPTKIKSVQTTAPIVSKNDKAPKPKKNELAAGLKEQQQGQQKKGQNSPKGAQYAHHKGQGKNASNKNANSGAQ